MRSTANQGNQIQWFCPVKEFFCWPWDFNNHERAAQLDVKLQWLLIKKFFYLPQTPHLYCVLTPWMVLIKFLHRDLLLQKQVNQCIFFSMAGTWFHWCAAYQRGTTGYTPPTVKDHGQEWQEEKKLTVKKQPVMARIWTHKLCHTTVPFLIFLSLIYNLPTF